MRQCARVIEQLDWDTPLLTDWIDRIFHEVTLATRPVVLIGQSLARARHRAHGAARLKDTKVRGAFLGVAAGLRVRAPCRRRAQPFGNVPTDPLPFPSMVVASTTDPLVSVERAQGFAADWGSDFSSRAMRAHQRRVGPRSVAGGLADVFRVNAAAQGVTDRTAPDMLWRNSGAPSVLLRTELSFIIHNYSAGR